MHGLSRPVSRSGFSLLEAAVSILILSMLLLMMSRSLTVLMLNRKTLAWREEAANLCHNAMETLLSLPLAQAKQETLTETEWTHHQRFQVQVDWEKLPEQAGFEKVTIRYFRKHHSLIQLSAFHPE